MPSAASGAAADEPDVLAADAPEPDAPESDAPEPDAAAAGNAPPAAATEGVDGAAAQALAFLADMASSCPLAASGIKSSFVAPTTSPIPPTTSNHASIPRSAYPLHTSPPSFTSHDTSTAVSSLRAYSADLASRNNVLHRGNRKNHCRTSKASRRSHESPASRQSFVHFESANKSVRAAGSHVAAAASDVAAAASDVAAAAASVAEASLDERVELGELEGRAREEAEAVQAAVFQAAQELDDVAAEAVAAADAAAEGEGETREERGQGLGGGSADGRARTKRLLQWARELNGGTPPAPALRARENRVMGCVAQVWLHVELEEDTSSTDGTELSRLKLRLQADSDSDLTRGICQLLLEIFNGRSVSAALALDSNGPAIKALTAALKPAAAGASSAKAAPAVRTSTFVSLLLSLQKRARALVAASLGRTPSVAPLPSIVIGRGGSITARGDFAVTQAQYLRPNDAAVAALVTELSSKRIGVVAHFYMDAEVQGVLVAARKSWPHIKISDSLVMADGALKMAQEGCDYIAVLGVDFMAENVRCVLEKGGFAHVPVVRMAASPIGCSLADAARSDAYERYLKEASTVPKSLHVIYINTALDTKAVAHHAVPTISCTSSNVVQTVLQVSQCDRGVKAVAHHAVPTISCTSSNVVQTVLQVSNRHRRHFPFHCHSRSRILVKLHIKTPSSPPFIPIPPTPPCFLLFPPSWHMLKPRQAFAQVPDLTLWYGPDTYMGANLVEMLQQLSTVPDDEVRLLHPDHTQASLRALLPQIRYFQEGACIVHDMFGQEVVSRLRAAYSDAFHTAHFEVPGEMFALAMEARARGRGTVGSTQNILDFVTARTREALERGYEGERLQFVLGTETGMVTSIVQAVQDELAKVESGSDGAADVEVEIVFPVDSSAVASTKEDVGNNSSSGSGGNGKAAGSVAAAMLPVVPGVKGGEGCSVTGGCASCPYMKMNSLDALMSVCHMLGQDDARTRLAPYEPDKFAEPLGPGTVADLGYLPILHMRHFQKTGRLSEELVADILTRSQSQHE
ncbi:unnamed protein product [Closterium sp. NIES-65]|nr:unnamed protein product [Closterium sp. NIES-65]